MIRTFFTSLLPPCFKEMLSPIQAQGKWADDRRQEESAQRAWKMQASSFVPPIEDVLFFICQVCHSGIGAGYLENQMYVLKIENQYMYDKKDNYCFYEKKFFLCCLGCAKRYRDQAIVQLIQPGLWNTPYSSEHSTAPYSADEHKRYIAQYLFFLSCVIYPHWVEGFPVKYYPRLVHTALHALVNQWIATPYVPKKFPKRVQVVQVKALAQQTPQQAFTQDKPGRFFRCGVQRRTTSLSPEHRSRSAITIAS